MGELTGSLEKQTQNKRKKESGEDPAAMMATEDTRSHLCCGCWILDAACDMHPSAGLPLCITGS